MANTGVKYPTFVATESVSPEDDNSWTNPDNVKSDNAQYASITAVTFDYPDISHRLKAQSFGASVPEGSVINGILVEIERYADAGEDGADYRVQLLDDGGALVGDNKAIGDNWPSSPTIESYGGSTDTWGASPTQAMVNDGNFGVAFSVEARATNADIYVDFIRVTIYYTEVVAPTVTTQAVSDKAETTGTGNGNMTDNGGEDASKRGVCWNEGGNPDVNDDKSEETDSFGTGAFSRSMTGLSAGTLYYVKAYAYNSAGYGYGAQVEYRTTYDEKGKEQVILVTAGEADSQTMVETAKEQTILGVLSSADIMTMLETGKEQVVLVAHDESESLTLEETARLQVILAAIGEAENLTLDEVGRLQVILSVLTSADIQTMQELAVTQVILSVVGRTDVQTMQELGKLQQLLAVIGETETLTLDETAREQIILAVLTSADIQAMVESLEQVILAVVGKEEGRLLISRRTTGKFRVLDSIREESVDRVLDSDIV